jgi:hypothetical protein
MAERVELEKRTLKVQHYCVNILETRKMFWLIIIINSSGIAILGEL